MLRKANFDNDNADVKAILGLMLEWQSTAGIAMPTVSMPHCLNTTLQSIAFGTAWVAVVDGEIVGAVMGRREDPWFTSDAVVTDVFGYVKPEHRKGMLGARLYGALRDYAKEIGAVWLKLAHTHATDIERKDKFFERLGLKQIGSVFMGDLRHDGGAHE